MHERLEQYAVPLILGGAAASVIGLIWLVWRGFKEGWGWGLAAIVPPFQLLFWWKKPRPATPPWVLILIGLAVSLGTIAAVQYANRIDLGERERIGPDGKPWLTLTGWDKSDYSFLKERKATAVLHMRNPDVDDRVVALLEGFNSLEELDLGDTAITDASLPVLAALPALRVLKLDGTAITDQGFRDHLLKKESLLELDLERMDRVKGVKAQTLREWKNVNKERKYLHRLKKEAP
jgi:hypothetical protein